MPNTKVEKLTNEELEAALREVDRRGCETRLKEPLTLGRALRAHIAALEAERDAAVRQGQADYRTLHDALGWAHEWHGAHLPPPWRAVTALIAERDEWRQRWQDEDNAARHAREAKRAERQRALDAGATLAAIRHRAEDEKRMVTVQPSHIAGLVTRVIDRILSAGEVSAPSAADPLHPNGRCTCAGEGACAWCARLRCTGCGAEDVDLCASCEATAKRAQDAMSASTVADAFAKVLTTLEACRIFINGPLGTQVAELRDAEIPAAIADLVSLERHMGAMGRAIQDAPHGETCMVGRSALVKHCTCWKRAASRRSVRLPY